VGSCAQDVDGPQGYPSGAVGVELVGGTQADESVPGVTANSVVLISQRGCKILRGGWVFDPGEGSDGGCADWLAGIVEQRDKRWDGLVGLEPSARAAASRISESRVPAISISA
jgi:hypothetical protein